MKFHTLVKSKIIAVSNVSMFYLLQYEKGKAPFSSIILVCLKRFWFIYYFLFSQILEFSLKANFLSVFASGRRKAYFIFYDILVISCWIIASKHHTKRLLLNKFTSGWVLNCFLFAIIYRFSQDNNSSQNKLSFSTLIFI